MNLDVHGIFVIAEKENSVVFPGNVCGTAEPLPSCSSVVRVSRLRRYHHLRFISMGPVLEALCAACPLR